MSSKNNNIIAENSKRWNKLPVGNYRVSILWLLKLNDFFLKFTYGIFSAFWKKKKQWEHLRYTEFFKGKNVLEVGSGFGYDGIVFSKQAESYTFAELNSKQLLFLQRITKIQECKNVFFEHLTDTENHIFHRNFQGFFAHGVLHHIPFEQAQKQFRNIDKYLEIGADVVFLMYPKERWILAGKPSFKDFGNSTDGGCPWTEYYDQEKIKSLVGDNYELVNTIMWGQNSIEFVNFELKKIKNN